MYCRRQQYVFADHSRYSCQFAPMAACPYGTTPCSIETQRVFILFAFSRLFKMKYVIFTRAFSTDIWAVSSFEIDLDVTEIWTRSYKAIRPIHGPNNCYLIPWTEQLVFNLFLYTIYWMKIRPIIGLALVHLYDYTNQPTNYQYLLNGFFCPLDTLSG